MTPSIVDLLRCSSLWAAIGNSPYKIFGLKQPIAESSHNDCAVPVNGMPAKCPLLCRDLGAIGAVAGDVKNI